MALSCNGFEDQTVRETQQLLSCKRECDTLVPLELNEFFALVADALERAGFPIADVTPEDAAEALETARCALQGRTITSFTESSAQGIILAQINELICAS